MSRIGLTAPPLQTGGPPYNSVAATVTAGKSHLGADVSDAIELGVLYDPAGIFGHKYWRAWSPFTTGAADENLHIGYGEDGDTWLSTGFTNPLDPYPGGGAAGNWADANMLDNRVRDGKIWAYQHKEHATDGSNGVYGRSYDGTTLSASTRFLDGTALDSWFIPCIVWDATASKYRLYGSTTSGGVSRTISRADADALTGPWANWTPVNLPLATVDHMGSPIPVGSKWVGLFATFATPKKLMLCSSPLADGINWTVGPALVETSSSGWEGGGDIYRDTLVDAHDGQNIYAWYVASTAGNQNNGRMSKKLTIPRSLIP